MSPVIPPPPKPPDPTGKGLKAKETNIFKRFVTWLKSLI